jgi:hypothetical protein
MKFKDFLRNSLFLRISLTSYVLEYYVFKICKVVSRPWPSLLGLKWKELSAFWTNQIVQNFSSSHWLGTVEGGMMEEGRGWGISWSFLIHIILHSSGKGKEWRHLRTVSIVDTFSLSKTYNAIFLQQLIGTFLTFWLQIVIYGTYIYIIYPNVSVKCFTLFFLYKNCRVVALSVYKTKTYILLFQS